MKISALNGFPYTSRFNESVNITVDIPRGKSKAFYANIQDTCIYGYIDGYTVDRRENDFALFVELETGQITLIEIDELTVI